MRFALPILLAVALAASASPALAKRKDGHPLPPQPDQQKQDFLVTQPVKRNAQPVDPLDFSAIFSADIFQKSLAVVGKPVLTAQDSQPAIPAPATAQDAGKALTFTPSVEVERATRRKLEESLLATTKTAAVQDRIRESLKTDTLWRQFATVLSAAGLTTSNLADVTAAYYIITWEVVNSNDTSSSAKSIQAVRDSVAAGMAADPRLAKMSDAEKQQAASVLAYMATIAADSVNELNSAGDEDGLVHLREKVHDSIMNQGVDLDRLLLGDNGFEAR